MSTQSDFLHTLKLLGIVEYVTVVNTLSGFHMNHLGCVTAYTSANAYDVMICRI